MCNKTTRLQQERNFFMPHVKLAQHEGFNKLLEQPHLSEPFH